MTLAGVIPLLTGPMIFVSVLLAGRRTERTRKQAWALGLASQLLLIGFGALSGHFAFLTHALVASAFAYNLVPKREKQETKR